MKPATLIVLIVLFLVPFGVLAYLQYTNVPDRATEIANEGYVLPALRSVEPAHVTELTLHTEAGEVQATHEPDSDEWQMTKPIRVLADNSQMRNLFTSIKNLRIRNIGNSTSTN